MINRYPDRFLFGSDVVAPKDTTQYYAVFEQYAPLWDQLTPEASEKVRKGNYERLFDAAARRVRAWEKAQKDSHRPGRPVSQKVQLIASVVPKSFLGIPSAGGLLS